MSQAEITFNILTSDLLAKKTSDAYSFDYYGATEWLKIIQFLLGRGYSNEAVEEIVRSKHTRWAADSRRDVEADAMDFFNYYRKNSDGIDAMLREED